MPVNRHGSTPPGGVLPEGPQAPIRFRRIETPVPIGGSARAPPFLRITLDEQTTRGLDGRKQLRRGIQDQDIDKEVLGESPRHRVGHQVERGQERAHRCRYQPDEETQLRFRLAARHRHLCQMGEGDIGAGFELGSKSRLDVVIEAHLGRLDDNLRFGSIRGFGHDTDLTPDWGRRFPGRSPSPARDGRLAVGGSRKKVIPSSAMRKAAIVVACFGVCATLAAQELEPALEYAQQLVQEHRYQEVIELMSHFEDLDDPEAQYVVAAEIGRAQYHLGDYQAANAALRKAVSIRPQRIESALYLEATSYLIGDREQAYAIFREVLKSGATDLYLAVTLPGETAFLTDPQVWEILDEFARPVHAAVDRGSMLGVELGQLRPDVEKRLGASSETPGDALTARAGPFLTWAFGFDETGTLVQIMAHNEHLFRYTPYRLDLGAGLDWRATPEDATSALGAPASTSTEGDELVVMSWRRDSVRLTLEFAPLRPPVPPGFKADRPVLRVVRMDAVESEPETDSRPE